MEVGGDGGQADHRAHDRGGTHRALLERGSDVDVASHAGGKKGRPHVDVAQEAAAAGEVHGGVAGEEGGLGLGLPFADGAVEDAAAGRLLDCLADGAQQGDRVEDGSGNIAAPGAEQLLGLDSGGLGALDEAGHRGAGFQITAEAIALTDGLAESFEPVERSESDFAFERGALEIADGVGWNEADVEGDRTRAQGRGAEACDLGDEVHLAHVEALDGFGH